MLASRYEEMDVTRDQWRVLDRIGARDPAGIKRAMKKYQVDTMEELIALLEHHKPQRKVKQRFINALGRLVPGSYPHDPHEKEVKRAMKLSFETEAYIKIRDRKRKVQSNYDG